MTKALDSDRSNTPDFAVQFRPLTGSYGDLGVENFSVGDLLVFQDTLLDYVTLTENGDDSGTPRIRLNRGHR